MDRRQTALNVSLGTILLLAFAFPIVLLVLAGEWFFRAAGPTIDRYFSRLGVPAGVVYVILVCCILFWKGLSDGRRRQWRNAFLSIALIPTMVSNWLFQERAPGVAHDLTNVWPLLLLGMIPFDRHVHRWEFLLGGILVATGIALNIGLFGSSTLASCVYYGLLCGIFAWFRVNTRSRTPVGQNSSDRSITRV